MSGLKLLLLRIRAKNDEDCGRPDKEMDIKKVELEANECRERVTHRRKRTDLVRSTIPKISNEKDASCEQGLFTCSKKAIIGLQIGICYGRFHRNETMYLAASATS